MTEREAPSNTEDPKIEASGSDSRRLGAYTTARISKGRVTYAERHTARLRRDAERLGLVSPDPRDVEALLRSAARAAFGPEPGRSHGRDGILRIEWSCEHGGEATLSAHPRPIGEEPCGWRARTSSVVHPGPERRRSAKSVFVPAYDQAREEIALDSAVEEALLFDEAGRLVEGGRSNFILVTRSRRLLTPACSLGAVEGLGLQILREAFPEIEEAEVRADALREVQGLFAVNAVRGVVPIVSLDGRSLNQDEDAHRRWNAVFGATRV